MFFQKSAVKKLTMSNTSPTEPIFTVPSGIAKGKPYLLSFKKNQYYIPESAVVSSAKKVNSVEDGNELGQLLFTKSPSTWVPFTHPDTLIQLKGNEGTCVYTSFEVPGNPVRIAL